jgi:hypothetical protein
MAAFFRSGFGGNLAGAANDAEQEGPAIRAGFLGESGFRDRKKASVTIPTQLAGPTRAIATIRRACTYLLGRVLIRSIGGGGLINVCFTPVISTDRRNTF